MADTDEVVLDEPLRGDASGHSSTCSGVGAEARDAVHEALIEVWAVLGKIPIPIHQFLKMGAAP